MRLNPMDVDVKTLSPLSLAFIGDGVYEMLVREQLVCEANRPPRELHHESVRLVRAEAQALAADSILPYLTEEEEGVFRRGRNAKTPRTDPAYHKATALEALFGYLYLCDRIERVRELYMLGAPADEE